MHRYIIRRIMQMIPVIILVSIIIFMIMHALPGDPARLMLAGAEGGAVGPERVQEIRKQMGLDDPLIVQYFRFVTNAARGDFGESIRLRTPVSELIMDRFGSTMKLAFVGLVFSLVIGLFFGIIAGIKPNSFFDTFGMAFSYIGVSMPVFWLGLILIFVFSFQLGWFPSAGGTGFRALVLPGITLGFASAGVVSRLTRSSLIEVLREDYIRTARSKGLETRSIILVHALKNAMIPVVTMVGLQFGLMLAGAVVTETVFSRPGLGRLIVQAILWMDYPLIQGSILFLAVIYLFVNLLVDISYAWLDPRIRYN